MTLMVDFSKFHLKLSFPEQNLDCSWKTVQNYWPLCKSLCRCVVEFNFQNLKNFKKTTEKENHSRIDDCMVSFFFTYFNLNLEGSWSHTKLITTKVKVKRKPARKKILIINLYNIFGSQRKKSLRLPYWHNLNTMVTYTIWDKVWSSSSLLLCLHSFPPHTPLLLLSAMIIDLMFLVTYILWFAKEISAFSGIY